MCEQKINPRQLAQEILPELEKMMSSRYSAEPKQAITMEEIIGKTVFVQSPCEPNGFKQATVVTVHETDKGNCRTVRLFANGSPTYWLQAPQ